ncbi:hypothetical protein GTP38_13360 [Duganella sp. FT94W]|uniref:Uncharacterized protein n=1 Tax=Duganella lactea TaxID=2692173 RepID=A0ABW9V9G3_9BURK|nr:hypothetical protein [Duganella lactea]
MDFPLLRHRGQRLLALLLELQRRPQVLPPHLLLALALLHQLLGPKRLPRLALARRQER